MSESIDSYITSFSGLHRERLEELRGILIGLYPTSSAVEALKDQLTGLTFTNGKE